jgi:hypothetical protein
VAQAASDRKGELMVTRIEWAKAFLKWADLPVTKHNCWALVAWESAEGGSAKWNPLNTTQRWSGSTDYNSVGVQNYKTQEDGLNATLKTIKQTQGFLGYGPIVAALARDALAHDTLTMVEHSAWGTGGLALRILHDVKTYWQHYSTQPIGQ